MGKIVFLSDYRKQKPAENFSEVMIQILRDSYEEQLKEDARRAEAGLPPVDRRTDLEKFRDWFVKALQ